MSTCSIAASLACFAPLSARSDDRVTYLDHVRPVLANHCLGCHNPDKLKGGLDLTSHRATMAGSSSGPVLKPGDPAGSALLGVITQEREPTMPPFSGRIPDAEIELIRRWIAGGCMESSSSTPVAAPATIVVAQPAAQISVAKPAEQLTLRYPLAEVVTSERSGVVADIDIHPSFALAAVAGQKQVLLYDIERMSIAGVLPFQSGFPQTLRFSRSGRLLIAGGGTGGKSGRVQIWSVFEGRMLGTVGEEMDAVLAADIDPADARIALGGPSRVAKIFATGDGQLLHRIEKHTDWITAVAYSPDGILLATADRGGNVFVWEAESFAPYQALAGHPAAVTSLSWRNDSNVLATSCEDGRVRWFDMNGGAMIKEWPAHDGGCSRVRFARNGQLVSTGRDRLVKQWDANGGLVRALEPMNDLALTAAIDEGSQRVIAGDLSGLVRVWSTADGKPVGDLRSNPPTLQEQLAHSRAAVDTANGVLEKTVETRKAMESAAATAAEKLATAQSEVTGAELALASAEAAVQSAMADVLKTTTIHNEAVAKANTLAQAATGAAAAFEQSVAALGVAADADAKAQHALAESQKLQSSLEAAALETERLAAASKDDASLSTAAQSARAAVTAATQVSSERAAASVESSRKLKAAVEASDKAKVDRATAADVQQAAQAAGAEAEAAMIQAQGRKSSMDNQTLAAAKALEQARARLAENTAALDSARLALATATQDGQAAANDSALANATLAKWQAGIARAELDAAREALSKQEAAFEPAATKSAASAATAQNALSALKDSRAKLANAPMSLAELSAVLATAEQALRSANEKSTSAKRAFAEREATLQVFAASVRALNPDKSAGQATTIQASAATQPVSNLAPATQPVAATPPADSQVLIEASPSAASEDSALAAAVIKATEALHLLQESVASAATTMDQAEKELKAAVMALATARDHLSAAEQEQTSLPIRMVHLEKEAKDAEAQAMADKAAADAARLPVDAARARLKSAEAEYERLLQVAAPVNTL